ncbi:hypothetical protein V8G54_035881, partial [Vigna mungo]
LTFNTTSTSLASHWSFPAKKTLQPNIIPKIIPHAYPTTMTFHPNPDSSLSSVEQGGLSLSSLQDFDKGNPQSIGFPTKESFPNVLNCCPVGITPSNWFCERFKTAKKFKFVKDMGISPFNWFHERSNHSKLFKLPSDNG